MLKPSRIAIALATVLCAACSTGTTPPADPAARDTQAIGLTATTWRLHDIQSMDDAQGNTRPQPDRVYTMRLTPDGRAAFQLDCNRGSTSYTVGAGEPGRGAITFGNVAMTRAMCPPGSLDSRIARDMGYVRSYTMQGDTLSLSLMADGGIYVWKPDTAMQSAQ
ncbi:META domain-containing protein [Massilia timonae]|uniref:META domain-containing protein n=1 Tax=Massilia timonae TaxID=47229 RepID=UPI002357FBD4|nr:META domain-containing protein [Massilia timonae]